MQWGFCFVLCMLLRTHTDVQLGCLRNPCSSATSISAANMGSILRGEAASIFPDINQGFCAMLPLYSDRLKVTVCAGRLQLLVITERNVSVLKPLKRAHL